MAAAELQFGAAERMALLLSHSRRSFISDRIMADAAENTWYLVMGLFLQRGNHLTLTG
jgi:hypothetical protein